MNIPANQTRAGHPGSVPPAQETSYLSRPEGRLGYDVAGHGSLVVLVPGMGDLRAGYRLVAPCLACCGLPGGLHRSSRSRRQRHHVHLLRRPGNSRRRHRPDAELGGPAVIVGNSMGAGSAVLAAAQQPGLISGLVLTGPFVRHPETSAIQRLLLRVAMAPPWAARSWKSYLPKLYAGRRPADFGEYRDQVVASIRRPGYAKAFSATTRTSHDPAEARLPDVTAPVLVVMGEEDPNFPDPRAEAEWIAGEVNLSQSRN